VGLLGCWCVGVFESERERERVRERERERERESVCVSKTEKKIERKRERDRYIHIICISKCAREAFGGDLPRISNCVLRLISSMYVYICSEKKVEKVLKKIVQINDKIPSRSSQISRRV
jgi:hypothetical protein